MTKRLLLLGSILIVLLLACCAAIVLLVTGYLGFQGATTAPVSASVSAADLQVIDRREVEIEGGRTPLLSPGGKWLAVQKDEVQRLCVYAADSLTEQHCVELTPAKKLHPYYVDARDALLLRLGRK